MANTSDDYRDFAEKGMRPAVLFCFLCVIMIRNLDRFEMKEICTCFNSGKQISKRRFPFYHKGSQRCDNNGVGTKGNCIGGKGSSHESKYFIDNYERK